MPRALRFHRCTFRQVTAVCRRADRRRLSHDLRSARAWTAAEANMTRREQAFAFGGGIVGALVVYGSVRLSNPSSGRSGRENAMDAGGTGDPAPSLGGSVDPA